MERTQNYLANGSPLIFEHFEFQRFATNIVCSEMALLKQIAQPRFDKVKSLGLSSGFRRRHAPHFF